MAGISHAADSACPPSDTVAPSTPAAGAAMTPVEYLAKLRELALRVGRLNDDPGAAGAIRRDLPERWTVADGDRMLPVPGRFIDESLATLETRPESWPCVGRELRARLHALQAEAEHLGPPPDDSASGRARTRLDAILQGREFRGLRPEGALAGRLRELQRFIGERLQRLFQGIGLSPAAGRVVLWSLAVALFALLAVALASGLRRLSLPQRAGFTTARSPVRRTWRDCAAAARMAVDRGDAPTAVRQAYEAALLRLQEAGLWSVAADRTNREYLRLLPSDHACRPPFGTLAGRFESIVYGGRGLTGSDLLDTLSCLEKLGCLPPSTPATARS